MFVWRKRKCKTCGHIAHTHENFVETEQRSRTLDAKPRPKKKAEPKPPKTPKWRREPVLVPVTPTPSARKKIEEILERWRLEEETMERDLSERSQNKIPSQESKDC